ncbi:High-affinity branched-chain amino acid transport system permease protein LivH [Methylobacterium crusticola]|uniref:High-affinity branched-chain amino acid transport system permease protein LivH n=1 Tax=Methylobacterium crusticola TaxID=1697972 RepID=A0ABQ4QX64_9HYPH|nr:branched-chain amino acid ABC transporter permease [Methylobacterium crusticola]GJD49264.1 High-affinity branched-chain amino acid transport system permease protein LivH [Methylobacterium crusticola]
MLVLSALVSGLAQGAMYGLVALGYHVTFAVSRTVNFAQGSAMMLGAVLGYVLGVREGWPMPLAVAAALALCAAFGLLVERVLVRPFVRRGSEAWLMATVAGGLVLDNAAMFAFGKEPRALPSRLAERPVEILGLGLYPLQLVIPVVGIAVAAALHLLSRRTAHGRALLAVVQNPTAARLMGIDVGRAVALSYAGSTLLAGIAGLLIAPLSSVTAEMGTLFGIKAFAVAIVGGIGSAPGVVAAGLAYGVVEALATALVGSSWTQIVVFAAVIGSLALRPNGLFGAAGPRKV